MARLKDYSKVYASFLSLSLIILMLHLYFYAHPLLKDAALTHEVLDRVALGLRRSGLYRNPYITKGLSMVIIFLSTIVRTGKGAKVEPSVVVCVGMISASLYLIPFRNTLVYFVGTVLGYCGLLWTFAIIGRMFTRFHEHNNDLKESFEQEREPVIVKNGILLHTRFFFKKHWHKGFISVVNPFRGTLVVGTAGSGKSYSVFEPFIEQMIEQCYTMLLYDFKMPDLTNVAYNALLRNFRKYDNEPQFYCINFKDPLRSNRCNPIAPEYLNDISDASESAKVIMEALNKGNEKKDFFWKSAEQYIGVCLWFLRIYCPPDGEPGDWCDFPHLIELVNQNPEDVLNMVGAYDSLLSKSKMFKDAMEANAQDQLQGQIASARLPLNDIAAPILYWVLSGDDFSLDLNDPEEPKVLCIGNDQQRQQVYGAALSLFTFRVIKLVNDRGKLPCGLVLDELPTLSVHGLDGLMATARSNKVAVVLGIQDISQIVADYGDKTAEKIIALPANVFVGASSIKTAEKYSKEFGKEFRRQESQTQNIDSESLNVSYHEEEIMPIRKITSLPQGTFIGKVAVDNDTPIEQPFFCGAIKIDKKEHARKRAAAEEIPEFTKFEIGDIWEKMIDPDASVVYVSEYVSRKIVKRRRRMGLKPLTRDALADRVQQKISSMSAAEYEDVLRIMLPEIRRRDIYRIIEKNYYDIKEDIYELVRTECAQSDGAERELPSDDTPEMTESLSEHLEREVEEGHIISNLRLNAEIRNILFNNGIILISQLLAKSRKDILNLKGIGSKSLDDIEKALDEVNLSLKGDTNTHKQLH